MRISDWSSDVCSSDLHFDAIDIVKLEVRLRRSLGDGRFVDIDPDGRLLAGVDVATGRDAANEDLGTARAAVEERYARNGTGIVGKIARARPGQLFASDRLNADRDVDQTFFAQIGRAT